MTGRTLRKLLDQYHAKGVTDAAKGARRDPFLISGIGADSTRARWAYDAGYQEGTGDFEALTRAVKQAMLDT
ncbi:MAG: hypothetical protein WC054_13180 [Candidatus Nanopelagicales bacterium]